MPSLMTRREHDAPAAISMHLPRIPPHPRHPLRLSPPPLRTADGHDREERRASWLELFFDLVVAGAVGQLAGALQDHPSLTALARFVILFIPIWWLWVQFSFYADRHESDAAADRFAFLAAIVGCAGLDPPWLAALLFLPKPPSTAGDGVQIGMICSPYAGLRSPRRAENRAGAGSCVARLRKPGDWRGLGMHQQAMCRQLRCLAGRRCVLTRLALGPVLPGGERLLVSPPSSRAPNMRDVLEATELLPGLHPRDPQLSPESRPPA